MCEYMYVYICICRCKQYHGRQDASISSLSLSFSLTHTVTLISSLSHRQMEAVRMNTSAPVPRPVPRVDIWMDDLSSTFANGLRVWELATCAHRRTVWLVCERDICSVRPPSYSMTDLWERFIIIEDLTTWARQFESMWHNLSGPPKHACILCGKPGIQGCVRRPWCGSSSQVEFKPRRGGDNFADAVRLERSTLWWSDYVSALSIRRYVHIDVYVHACVHTYIYTYIHIYTYMYVYSHIRMYIHIIYMCVYIYMFVARRHTASCRFCCSSLSQKERTAHLGFEMSERTRDEKCIQGGEDS